MKYLKNVLIAIDQFVNALALGDPDETISSRMGRWGKDPVRKTCKTCHSIAKTLCWFLDKIDKNHCADSIEDDNKDDLINIQ